MPLGLPAPAVSVRFQPARQRVADEDRTVSVPWLLQAFDRIKTGLRCTLLLAT